MPETKKTSADYQREFRQRMKDFGFVKKEVWIRPENAAALQRAEQQLRKPYLFLTNLKKSEGDKLMNSTANKQVWQANTLLAALQNSQSVQEGIMSAHLIEGTDPVVVAIMHGYGDLPINIAISGDHIYIESFMWSRVHVTSPTELNEGILRMQKVLAGAHVSLEKNVEGEDCYVMVHVDEVDCDIEDLIEKIQDIALNVINVTEALEGFLKF